jgi:YfiR/HmsC-like
MVTAHFLPLLLLFMHALHSQEFHPTETQVKATYLTNFGKFVTRPQTPPPPSDFVICILGKDPFGPVLDTTVAGEKISGKPITVRRLSGVQEVSRCNVLYISASESGRVTSILSATQRISVLTVSDIPHFAEYGGTIGLVNQGGKIRFEVNRASAQQRHLVLSSELLKVAIRIIDQTAQAK